MFGREMKTKLASINSEVNAKLLQQAAADTDAVNKARGKHYAGAKAKAIEREISVGDKVLLRQNKTCKLDANFLEKPYIVIGEKRSELVCEDKEGVSVRRNTTFAKRLPSQDSGVAGDTQVIADGASGSPAGDQVQRRTQRQCCLPSRYGNYRVH
ncbi:hypothetical protein EB796_024347 [Bugula neritina]|uniref:Uncharacterized protein n=1 Tax=Bugula neritina TaxID=10212 RepID=A0A7J7IV98_BUGNE|nr:hypothetical protein EB796_024347 [Bugula neritina]